MKLESREGHRPDGCAVISLQPHHVLFHRSPENDANIQKEATLTLTTPLSLCWLGCLFVITEQDENL